jgi:GH24 family phage-related lysozyme (muramidase)
MKKILSILATAALLSTVASNARAAEVEFPGDVTASCTLTVTDGALTENATPAESLTTTTDGTAVVTCNDATKTLTLTNTAASNTIPAPQTAPTIAFGFNGGNGVFAAATGTTAAVTTPTKAAGDTANIQATVTAATDQLLKSGSYVVVVDAAITP